MLEGPCRLDVFFLSPFRARMLVQNSPFESAVGHEATARVYTQLLGVEVKAERKAIKVRPGDAVLVGQLGQRLPEGRVLSKEELEALPIQWILVEVRR